MKTTTTHYHLIDTVLGQTIIAEQHQALVGVWFPQQRHFNGIQAEWQRQATSVLKQAEQQLVAYFQGELQQFDLPLQPHGTAFQQRVWHALLQLDYGHTTSYGHIAHRIDQPRAVRAVGAAIGKNPISIIIPCHRVVGSQQQLTGYAGGLERKQWLLDWERYRGKSCI